MPEKKSWYGYAFASAVAVLLTYFAFEDYDGFINPESPGNTKSKVFRLVFKLIDSAGGQWLVLGIMCTISIFLLIITFQRLKSGNAKADDTLTPTTNIATSPSAAAFARAQHQAQTREQPDQASDLIFWEDRDVVPLYTWHPGKNNVLANVSIKKRLNTFELYMPDGDIRTANIKQLITVQYHTTPKGFLISVASDKGPVPIDLFGRIATTKVATLFWQNFDNRELRELAAAFGLDLKKVINTSEVANLSARLKGAEGLNDGLVQLALKSDRHTGMLYAVVFHFDYPERNSDGTLYVHGIWQAHVTS